MNDKEFAVAALVRFLIGLKKTPESRSGEALSEREMRDAIRLGEEAINEIQDKLVDPMRKRLQASKDISDYVTM